MGQLGSMYISNEIEKFCFLFLWIMINLLLFRFVVLFVVAEGNETSNQNNDQTPHIMDGYREPLTSNKGKSWIYYTLMACKSTACNVHLYIMCKFLILDPKKSTN